MELDNNIGISIIFAIFLSIFYIAHIHPKLQEEKYIETILVSYILVITLAIVFYVASGYFPKNILFFYSILFAFYVNKLYYERELDKERKKFEDLKNKIKNVREEKEPTQKELEEIEYQKNIELTNQIIMIDL